MARPAQPDLFAPPMPPGFRYAPDLITREEEARLVAAFATVPFVPCEFRGYAGRRAVIYFGWRYDFNPGRPA